MAKLEERCAAGEFLVGKSLTCADFYVGGLYTNHFANPEIYEKEKWDELLTKYPNFKAYGERYTAAT